MTKLLVIRFSALGDIAMTIHTLQALHQQNSDIKIYFLTKKKFSNLIEPLDFVEKLYIDDKNKDDIKLIKFGVKIAKSYDFDLVIDLHGVLRSYLLDIVFKLFGKKVYVINKGRKEKKQLTRKHNKKLRQLKHTVERYSEVFKAAGININMTEYRPNYGLYRKNKPNFIQSNYFNIGIAPFAAHKSKEYPVELMEKVIEELNNDENLRIFIFGGGNREKKISENWAVKFKNATNLIGKFSIDEEINAIAHMDVMITMDSGNMHLASLVGTKNISIWGGTHPFLGFTPYKNFDNKLVIQKNLKCRPCSVFGTDKCYYKNFECLNIPPHTIIEKIRSLKSLKNK